MMPIRNRTDRLLDALEAQGVTHVIGLPDSTLAPLFSALTEEGTSPVIRWVGVTREGEAFAVASGLWLGGATPVVAVQCTGLMESGDALRGTAQRMGVPLVALVTWRGHRTMVDAGLAGAGPPFAPGDLVRSDVDSAALLLVPTLRAWNVPWEVLGGGPEAAERGGTGDDVGRSVARAFDRARGERRPVALLMIRGGS